jgi:hypothetical protein
MGEMGDAYKVLVKKCEGIRPFGRPRHRWEDNIKIELKMGFEDVDCIHLL